MASEFSLQEPVVHIGLLDEDIGVSDHTDFNTNKIGGKPDWTSAAEKNPPPSVCQVCNKPMCLLVQLYCPLDSGSNPLRTLYVFCCINPTCWTQMKSWKVYRSQEKESSSNTPTTSRQDSWVADQDDWGTAAPGSSPSTSVQLAHDAKPSPVSPSRNRKISRASEESDDAIESVDGVISEDPFSSLQSEKLGEFLILEQQRLSALTNISSKPVIKSYYISVIHEPEGATHRIVRPNERSSLSKSKKKEETSSEEGYERTQVKHGDVVFYKFLKRVARCPEQIIRYQWNGSPLFLTKPGNFALSNCTRCKSKRTFEMQIMPRLVQFLELTEGNVGGGPPIEFGTVFVFTCKNSCWSETDTWLEEIVLIQNDPDDDKLMSAARDLLG